ncbi:MAG: tRNA (N6-isopentenyl adenosine(37)-C2)-methylthiotransferase MiaB [candidate division KSB1 bacterium]|nr:tRNA (N6-isopentenyl adenosine(37)-C2)-methylthiotransferase MiaB [candidate division KSB1 bacterium]MDZ7339846.1 tRNA (N6-isopentenyl adenosine(37)-C2)-methylthiotransferase MiaB [candidate division KSB1 bacterium]
MTKQSKKYYIETYGCQMNKYDSELVAGILRQQGYEPAASLDDSDLILLNTCSVRQHAETRVLGRLDALRLLKSTRPDLLIGVLGCMAMRLQDEILQQKPFVNFIIGPDNYRSLPDLLQKLNNGSHEHQLQLAELDDHEVYSELYPSRQAGVSAWVAIMRGCNNFCAYCIVPYVRGRERSRPAKEVVAEVTRLVQDGFLEVTLLGQNVNSYHDGRYDFADLVRQVADVPGLARVRFATSHPKDLSGKLIEVMAEHPRICKHLHLPVQSGSDKILKLMNRNYTRDHYLQLIELAREKMPQLGLYTDIIVGFPGETEADFEATVDLVRRAEFDAIFVFKYSPRAGTTAFQWADSVPETEKTRRLQLLNQLQDEITQRRHERWLGSTQTILVEGQSKKKKKNQYMGRTDSNHIVVFSSGHPPAGSLVNVQIVATAGRTLFGELQ